MKKKVLVIDTSSNTEVEVCLIIRGDKKILIQTLDKKRAQVMLPMVEKILAKHNLSLQDLTAIEVNTGPGSFTGLRVGISIANMLGNYLRIPINNLPIGKIVEPTYS